MVVDDANFILPRRPRGPYVSCDLIRRFLAFAHAFTTLGLEAEAPALSCGPEGVIKCLVLPPQINEVNTVSDIDSDVAVLDAIQRFQRPRRRGEDDEQTFFHPRCWIHTHARFKPFMSCKDLYQLFGLTQENRSAFGIVLSPRDNQLKALCVKLTDVGF